MGIRGSEKADTEVKSALSLPVMAMKYPGSDLLPRVANLCHEEWQQSWNAETNSKLFEIKPIIGKGRHKHRLNRRENTIINRLRIKLDIHASHTSIYCRVTVVQSATNAIVSLQLHACMPSMAMVLSCLALILALAFYALAI